MGSRSIRKEDIENKALAENGNVIRLCAGAGPMTLETIAPMSDDPAWNNASSTRCPSRDIAR